MASRGTRLLYHQHGGGYGLQSQLALEDYEIRVSDQFYTWGWKRKDTSVLPLSPAISSRNRNHRGDSILLNCADYPLVPCRLMFEPMPGTIETMHRNTCEFLIGLPDRRRLVIRPYPTDYGWGALKAMHAAAPEAKYINDKIIRPIPLIDWLCIAILGRHGWKRWA